MPPQASPNVGRPHPPRGSADRQQVATPAASTSRAATASPADGGDLLGNSAEPRVLFPEQSRKGHPRPKWSDEDIIAAIKQWARIYGEPPGSVDWNPSLCRHRGTPQRAAPFLSGDYPHSVTVIQRFGGWVPALKAAGFDARNAGPRTDVKSRADRLSRRNLQRLRAATKTVAHVAAPEFAAAVRAVATAEKTGEPELLQDALLECAAVAVAWADRADR